MLLDEEIIVAISTPVGEGAISIVRVSGKGAIDLVDKIFDGEKKLKDARPNSIHHGKIIDSSGSHIDEVLVAVFRNPNSYTTEDMVEINCHGGWYVTNKVLQVLLETGSRLAEPGEFTKRAFLNGRIDLSQAEAVADIIRAKSDLAHRASIAQLEGGLSKKINHINNKLIDLIGLIELELDFVEEDITFTSKESILNQINSTVDEIKNIIESYKFGKLYREGIKLVIAGKPNVGKSSLLNQLIQEDRAIVTPIPGTTRDVIEENFVIDGALFRIIDTAGLRLTTDFVEIEGVKRSYDKINESDLLLYLIDITQESFIEDIEIINDLISKRKLVIIAFNKIDQKSTIFANYIELFDIFSDIIKCEISALIGTGIKELKKVIFSLVFSEHPISPESSVLITNERHKQALLDALKNLELARSSTTSNQSGEFISVDIRSAIDSLGLIIGKTTSDEILNNIFSKFCIGK